MDIAVMRLEPAIVGDTYGKLNAAGNRFLSICWTKLFLYLLHIVTACVSGKICAMMTSDRNKIVLTILLVFASPEILLSVARQWGTIIPKA